MGQCEKPPGEGDNIRKQPDIDRSRSYLDDDEAKREDQNLSDEEVLNHRRNAYEPIIGWH